MTTTELPAPIKEFVDATNAGDTERFLDVFTADAYLNDWGREFHGINGVRDWNRTDNIGMSSAFQVVSLASGAQTDEFIVTLEVRGNGFNGTGALRFQLREGKIARVLIG